MDINQLLKLKDEEIQGHLQVNEKLRKREIIEMVNWNKNILINIFYNTYEIV